MAVRAVGHDGGALGDSTGREAVVTATLCAAQPGVVIYLAGNQPTPGSGDGDEDGVGDTGDVRPVTASGAAVDPPSGCSIAQLVPCAGPFGSSEPWASHRDYVLAVTHVVQTFLDQGLMTQAEATALLLAAAQSDCGDGQ